MPHIRLENVDLVYPVRHNRGLTLKEFFVKGVFRKQALITEIHALRQVSLSVRDGERLGIIGFNGAGKSTLLRTIAGIFPIVAGRRLISGSICSLFDIQVGFESEATGWQNIFYRGFLQGETPQSVRKKLHSIADFSELGQFLDLPIRCYSAGMLTRLAFSIATSAEPEILLIDEVFGTGDLVFQKKAEERMKDFMHRADIVVMVGHNLPFLEEFCSRVVWLDQGRLRLDGPASKIINEYTYAAKEAQAAPTTPAAA